MISCIKTIPYFCSHNKPTTSNDYHKGVYRNIGNYSNINNTLDKKRSKENRLFKWIIQAID